MSKEKSSRTTAFFFERSLPRKTLFENNYWRFPVFQCVRKNMTRNRAVMIHVPILMSLILPENALMTT